jgi:hypothetical protein
MSGGSDFENKYGSRRRPGIVDCGISRTSGIDRARSAGKRLGVREFTLAAPMRYAWLASGFIHIVASSPLCPTSDC